MRNPIFSTETVFLDRAPDGTLHYVAGDRSRTLSDGTRIIKLDTRQSLVRLEMESGASLTLSPESVFALSKADGNVVRYMPIDEQTSTYSHLIGWGRYPDNADLLRFRVAGMMCAAGLHSLERTRASNVRLPGVGWYGFLDYLDAVQYDMKARGELGQTHPIKVEPIGDDLFVKTRVLTKIVGLLLKDKTQAITFHPDDTLLESRWAFLHGLLSTSPREGDDIVFRNRDSLCVRMVHDMLWQGFGVTSTLSIHAMESRITASSRTQLPHTLRLSAEDRGRARACGLDPTGPEKVVKERITDTIKSMMVLDKRSPAVIVVPGLAERKFPLTANTFEFAAEFSLPEALVDLAAHPILTDSSDPALFEEAT